MYHHILPARAAARLTSASTLAERISSARKRIADWLTTAANYYTAAAVYEQLSRLSDAELHRRGLSRTTLAADICQASGHANR
jgi:hypothetical protein